MPNTTEVTIGTEQAKRSLQELQSVADGLEQKLKSIGTAMGGGNATQADSANFFSTASQLSSVRSQMSNVISGSATPAGGSAGSPFSSNSSDNPFAAPQFKMQKLGDVQSATNFVMQNSDGAGREFLMSQVLSGSIPVEIGQAVGRGGGGGGGGNSGGAGGGYVRTDVSRFYNNTDAFFLRQAGAFGKINSYAQEPPVPGSMGADSAGNPLPFQTEEPSGPSSKLFSPGMQAGWQRLQYDYYNGPNAANAAMTRTRQMQAFGLSAGLEAAHFVSGMAEAYTQSVISGTPQPLAFGQAYGGLGGFAIGAIAGGLFGGPIGAAIGGGIGATVGGPMINALQASSVAKAATELSLAPMAQQNGLDAGVMTNNAHAIATNYNNSKVRALGPSIERDKRNLGIYAGNDQASEQDAASVMSTLSGGYLQSGVDPNTMGIDGQTAALIKSAGGGKLAAQKAASIAKVQSVMASTGGNYSAIISKVGLPDFLTAASERNLDPDTRAGLIQTYGDLQRTNRDTGIATSLGDIGRSDYAASGSSGLTLEQRSGSFNSMTGGIRGRISALDAEIAVNAAAPGGGDPAFDAAKKAMRSAAAAELADEYTKRAQSKIGQIEAVAGAHTAEAGVGMAYANLYGGAGDFAKPTAAMASALSSEASDLRGQMGNPSLPYADKMRIRARLAELATQIGTLPAQQAQSEFGRRNLTGDVSAANASVISNQANLYGDNASVESAGASAYNVQRGIYNNALITMHDPYAGVETRGQAALRADNASNFALQIQAGTRQTVISRIQQSASANQAELSVGMTKAQFGSGADMRMAGAGLVAAYGVEEGKLTEQLNAKGTTVEQKFALRSQIASLQSQSITLTESARDSGFQKDFITGYELTATKLQGQSNRQQLLPFSPGNMMQNSLEMIKNNQKGLSMLDAREADLRKAGTLSPERQMEIETQRQNLITADAQQISFLANDLPNRLPAMAAGKPAFAARFNSGQLAAMAVRGTGIRSFGAVGGGQLHDQNDFYAPFIANDATANAMQPTSTTQGLNSASARGAGGSGGDNGNLVSAIERLITKLDANVHSGNQSGMRPNEGVGAIASAVYGKRANLDTSRPQ